MIDKELDGLLADLDDIKETQSYGCWDIVGNAAQALRRLRDERDELLGKVAEAEGDAHFHVDKCKELDEDLAKAQSAEMLAKRDRKAANADIIALRGHLQQLVTDYEDVPDATDADGQAVFADARAALSTDHPGAALLERYERMEGALRPLALHAENPALLEMCITPKASPQSEYLRNRLNEIIQQCEVARAALNEGK